MNTPLLHQLLLHTKKDEPHHNAVIIRDIRSYVNCDIKENNVENFEHFVNGDLLVYSECLQSTPMENKEVNNSLVETDKLYMSRVGVATFSNTGIDKVRKRAISKLLVYTDGKVCGTVMDSSLLAQHTKDSTYYVLGILAWLNASHTNMMNDLDGRSTMDIHCVCEDFEYRCLACGMTFQAWREFVYKNNGYKTHWKHEEDHKEPQPLEYDTQVTIGKVLHFTAELFTPKHPL